MTSWPLNAGERTVHLTRAAADLAVRPMTWLRSQDWMQLSVLLVVFIAIGAIRLTLVPWQSGDFTAFLQPWMAYLREHGFHGLGDQFADYNMPYLYLLLIGAKLPIEPVTWVKAIGFVSDVAMAAGCGAVLTRFDLPKHFVVAGAGAALLLPEVLLNSAAWGQADSTYTALIVWAMWAALSGRSAATWILFALAFTFKLQAAFLLPVFVVAQVSHRWKPWTPVVGVGAALCTEIPALIAGRSPLSLAEIYLAQTNGYRSLTLSAPSVYAFTPDWTFDLVRPAGIWFAVATTGLVSYAVIRRARVSALSAHSLLLFGATLGLLAPFVLPQMHERYFYAGNVLLFVLALVERRLLPLALVSQAVAVMAYSSFLLATPPALSLPILSLAQGGVVLTLAALTLRTNGFSLSTLALQGSVRPSAPDR